MSFTAIVPAIGTLTSSGVAVDTQTVVVGGKTYTTQAALTDVDGNVLMGANAAATLQNLFDAINLTGTPGTQYALSMTKNKQVRATAVAATTLVVTAAVGGTIGNNIPSTETQTNWAWGAATLASGAGDTDLAISQILASNQLNASAAQDIIDISARINLG
jgi:hypothetical protein